MVGEGILDGKSRLRAGLTFGCGVQDTVVGKTGAFHAKSRCAHTFVYAPFLDFNPLITLRTL